MNGVCTNHKNVGCRGTNCLFYFLATLFAVANLAVAQPILNIGNSAGETYKARIGYHDENSTSTGAKRVHTRAVNSQNTPANAWQPVSIDFGGTLSGFIDIPSGALLYIEGAFASGFPSNTPQISSQPTSGGTLQIYADRNKQELLLSGTIGAGLLYQSNSNLNILNFDANDIVLTGGSLLSFFTCKKANLSIKMDNPSTCIVTSKRCFIQPMCWTGNCAEPTPTPIPTPYVPNVFVAELVSGQVIANCPDCAGVPNGGKVFDQCGVCGGDNSSCKDCAGVPNGSSRVDQCGVCNGNNSCLDCRGVPFGGAVRDRCGVCQGTNACVDCAGVPNGGKVIDQCGVCGGNNSTCKDCAGVPNGGKVLDRCGVCGGTNACVDCAGVPFGGKVIDQCGVCGGNNSCKDCAGVPNGPKRIDQCGVCGGNNSCIDCAGVPYGGKVIDQCGVCGGNNSTCKDCAGTINGTKRIDKCGVCGGNNSCVDCAGTPNGGKTVDRCGVCGGNNSCVDCANTPFGGKVPDECGICGGDGSTCATCTENPIGELIRRLDTGVDALKKYAQSLGKLLRNTRGDLNTADQKLLGEVESLFTQAWQDLNIKIPVIILVCPQSMACAEVSHAAAIQDYERISNSMNDIIGKLSKRVTSLVKQQQTSGELSEAIAAQRTRRARALKDQAANQNTENLAGAKDIPTSTKVCS